MPKKNWHITHATQATLGIYDGFSSKLILNNHKKILSTSVKTQPYYVRTECSDGGMREGRTLQASLWHALRCSIPASTHRAAQFEHAFSFATKTYEIFL